MFYMNYCCFWVEKNDKAPKEQEINKQESFNFCLVCQDLCPDNFTISFYLQNPNKALQEFNR